MIQAETIGVDRIYRVPPALLKVAMELFGQSGTDAFFDLARRMTLHNIHTTELIADRDGAAAAVEFARQHLLDARQPRAA